MDATIIETNYNGLNAKRRKALLKQGIKTNVDLALLHGDDERIERLRVSLGVPGERIMEWVTRARQLCPYDVTVGGRREETNGTKKQFLHDYFNQVETQVHFADTRAALLVAGNSVLLAINMVLLHAFAGGTTGRFSLANVEPVAGFVLALGGALFLMISLVYAFCSALPSKIHGNPPAQFFLLSHVARLTESKFIQTYEEMSNSQMEREALCAIHGKAVFAAKRFGRIRNAIKATLISLVLQVAAVIAAGLVVIFR
jgi:hypothetical protein